jgi:site-specific DNA recombinase
VKCPPSAAQVRPRAEWIAVAILPVVSPQQFADVHERLRHTQQWSRRNTKGEYLLRQLVSCRRCGLAHQVGTNGRDGYDHCKGGDTLVQRRRPEPCHAPAVRADHLDPLVWQDLRELLLDPSILQDAEQQAQQHWPGTDRTDARLERAQALQRQQATTEQQTQHLIEAYTAQVLTWEELRERRTRRAARLASVERELHALEATAQQEVDLAKLTRQAEQFRATIAQGLDAASFAQRRALVELLIDRVVVDAPNGDIRSIIPLTGRARRKGVLPLRHRTAQRGGAPARARHPHFPQSRVRGTLGRGVAHGARRAVEHWEAVSRHDRLLAVARGPDLRDGRVTPGLLRDDQDRMGQDGAGLGRHQLDG